jgi:hypothetical protein
MTIKHLKCSGPLFAAALLSACGGSGGGSAGIDRTGAPSTIAAFGTVTAFGSVVVNGVRYDTGRAQFVIDDNPGSQEDLAVGDVVVVVGTLSSGGSSGVATSVTFDDQVEGPIAAIDSTAGTFIVLGQTVRVTADTSFDDRIEPQSLAGLAVGAFVEVSGLIESDGSIRATRIEPKPAGGQLELTGTVTNHDPVARTFNVNAQVVSYASVSVLRNFPGGMIANGQTVEIKGGAVANGVWSPASIEYQTNPLAGAAGERREVEGFITRFVSATNFTVANLAVTTTGQTVFEGGGSGDLGLNVKVEVEGALNAAGVLVATKVDIRRSAAVRIAARVDSVDAVNRSFVVLGIVVRTDGLTRLEDKVLGVRPFGVENLNAGDYVEVRGVELPAGSGEIRAALVERDDPEPDSELRGSVQAIAAPNFTIVGVTISTNGATRFRAVDDSPMTAAQFFAAAAVGDLVNARGAATSARVLAATEVEFED